MPRLLRALLLVVPIVVVSLVAAPATSATAAPTDLRVVSSTSTSLTVAWTAPVGATQYKLVYSTSPTFSGAKVKRTTSTQVTMGGLTPDTAYYARVRVVDGTTALSPWSTTLPTRTPPTEPPPEEPPTDTIFGANYTDNPAIDESVYAGRAKIARVFFQRLTGVTFMDDVAVKEAYAAGIRSFVISWSDTNLTAIRTFLAGIPDDLTIYSTYNHEPENDRGGPGSSTYRAWSTEYKRQWTIQSPLMRAEGFIPTNILMAWTLDPRSGRNVADWTPPSGTVDVFAFDAYYGKGKDPYTQVARMVAAAEDAGIAQIALAEAGSPATDPEQLVKTARMRAAVIAAGTFTFANYWNSLGGTFDSRMDEDLADAWFGPVPPT